MLAGALALLTSDSLNICSVSGLGVGFQCLGYSVPAIRRVGGCDSGLLDFNL